MTSNQPNFLKITNQFSVEDFEKIKEFILEKGNRKTYRNMDNNNPFYDFEKFQAFLGADIGAQNIYNETNLSNFNELTLRDDNNYYKILIVRKGDIQTSKKGILKGMKENEVYFVDVYEKGFNKITDSLFSYLQVIKNMN